MFCLCCHFWISARIVNIRAINAATALLGIGLPISESEQHSDNNNKRDLLKHTREAFPQPGCSCCSSVRGKTCFLWLFAQCTGCSLQPCGDSWDTGASWGHGDRRRWWGQPLTSQGRAGSGWYRRGAAGCLSPVGLLLLEEHTPWLWHSPLFCRLPLCWFSSSKNGKVTRLLFISAIPTYKSNEKKSAVLFHPYCFLNFEVISNAAPLACSGRQHAEELPDGSQEVSPVG